MSIGSINYTHATKNMSVYKIDSLFCIYLTKKYKI